MQIVHDQLQSIILDITGLKIKSKIFFFFVEFGPDNVCDVGEKTTFGHNILPYFQTNTTGKGKVNYSLLQIGGLKVKQ